VIFVSTSCLRNNKVGDSIKQLAEIGFQNIELSGGTSYYASLESDLLRLQDKYNLSYRCHNYFPPPEKPFVLNLASSNSTIRQASIDHFKAAITLSKKLGANKFGFHAGFFVDIELSEIGKKVERQSLSSKEKAIDRFCDAYFSIQQQQTNTELFIENNVFSQSNSISYNGKNPFMMTNFDEYLSLREKINFNLLLDVAHLKVSSQTLGLNWGQEFQKMMEVSSYVHISDNDGCHDLNNALTKPSEMFSMLKGFDTTGKDFTLEVYDGFSSIEKSYEVLLEAIS